MNESWYRSLLASALSVTTATGVSGAPTGVSGGPWSATDGLARSPTEAELEMVRGGQPYPVWLLCEGPEEFLPGGKVFSGFTMFRYACIAADEIEYIWDGVEELANDIHDVLQQMEGTYIYPHYRHAEYVRVEGNCQYSSSPNCDPAIVNPTLSVYSEGLTNEMFCQMDGCVCEGDWDCWSNSCTYNGNGSYGYCSA